LLAEILFEQVGEGGGLADLGEMRRGAFDQLGFAFLAGEV